MYRKKSYLCNPMEKEQHLIILMQQHGIRPTANRIIVAKTLAEGLRVIGDGLWENVPIESIREGEVPGTHVVSWDSEEDTIVITHIAKGRRGFALGAVLAAEEFAKQDIK